MLQRLNLAKMYNFGLRGNYPSRYPPTPKVIKEKLLSYLNFHINLNFHMRDLAQDMLWDLRSLQFEFIPALSWIKDIVAVNSFLSNTRQGAVNSLTFSNCSGENPRAYYFYAILSLREYFNEEKFVVVEFRCVASESNSNQSEMEVFDSDSDDIFLEIDV